MRPALNIYDVSGLVHCGQNIRDYASRYAYGFPVGGMQYLLKHVVSDIVSFRDVVLCFDIGRSFRKDIDKRYKAGRVPNKDVWAQLDVLYDILPKCGIVCHGVDTFEADDLIFNVVEANDAPYDYHEITIFGTDYDLTHNITSGKIRFDSVSSQVNCVNYNNFPHAMYKDKTILPNTISAYKVFCGDKSDRVKPFVSNASGLTGLALYNKYVEIIKGQKQLKIKQIRSQQLLEIYIKQLGTLLNDIDRDELAKRIRLVYPVKVVTDNPNKFKEYTTQSGVNIGNLVDFLSTINDRTSLKTLGKHKVTPPESLAKVIKNKGDSLKSGEYAVDRGRHLDVGINTEICNLKSF